VTELSGGSDPDADLARIGELLADALLEALPGWVESSVISRYSQWVSEGGSVELSEPELRELASEAAVRASDSLTGPLRALLSSDVDAQLTTPLSLMRSAVFFPVQVLAAAGVPPVERDPFEVERFPEDHYRLLPSSLKVFGETVRELALVWGAQKAITHRKRHSGTG
jgi:hypothetical protein